MTGLALKIEPILQPPKRTNEADVSNFESSPVVTALREHASKWYKEETAQDWLENGKTKT